MMPTEMPSYYSPKRKREPSERLDYARIPSWGDKVLAPQWRGDSGNWRFGGERLLGQVSPGNPNQEKEEQNKLLAEELCVVRCQNQSKTMLEALPPSSDESNHIQDDQQLPVTISDTEDKLPATPTKSPSKKKPTPSPSKQQEHGSPSNSRKQRFSPPLTETNLEDPFTWHDDEITGHDPSDPTDDGYGINGVGFKPTAAMAWARSQKRQRQVSEWKTREARDAREKRRERRNDDMNLDTIRSIHKGAIQKRVKFDV
ncbi:hypothetical protein N7481_004580 [Penicillium waksmanii]|uniref:uncharacterized protein n=1 Tax=Penicillium waksmanii TaxID=69791 RepID=UPI002549731B|nr:uncharacterized protein N7481_004580 [Penicillium waksmanii]KAJ5989370.1 hypothetical protein N7481_004580 [Penicillium waksmanii]